MSLLRRMVLRDSAAVKYKTGSQAWAVYQQVPKASSSTRRLDGTDIFHLRHLDLCICDYVKQER